MWFFFFLPLFQHLQTLSARGSSLNPKELSGRRATRWARKRFQMPWTQKRISCISSTWGKTTASTNSHIYTHTQINKCVRVLNAVSESPCHSPVFLKRLSTALPHPLTPALVQLISTPAARRLQSAAAPHSLLCHCQTQRYLSYGLLHMIVSESCI